MKRLLSLVVIIFLLDCLSIGQVPELSFSSSDSILNRAFLWAKRQALSYRRSNDDPVGPWYEGSLPGRDAFCIRDISHQCIGAEILGMQNENKNMFSKFVSNISESKNWCTYWEINKYNKPAPVDYNNDKDFWYNLDANCDVIYACWRLFNWTGDRYFISDPGFLNFFDRSLNQYISKWKLEPDSLLERPESLNNSKVLQKKFNQGYGLPSYAENVPGLIMSADLIAALYQGNISYSKILYANGLIGKSSIYRTLAEKYFRTLDTDWWDRKACLFNTWYSFNGNFGKGEGEVYLLWFDILKNGSKKESVIRNLTSGMWNIENTSYFPLLLYKNGYWKEAYHYLLYCSDPSTKRRDYPEVSFGVVEGIVEGLMGISCDGYNRVVTSLFHSTDIDSAALRNLPVLGTYLDISYEGSGKAVFHNSGSRSIRLKAGFSGQFPFLFNENEKLPVTYEYGPSGRVTTYTEVSLQPGNEIIISAN